MAENRAHKTTANRIAKKLNAEYNEGKGADIISNSGVIEVETLDTVGDAPRQLQGYRRPVYIAGTNKEAVERALEVTKNTTIGVMDNQGNIIRRSPRKK